MKIFYLLSMFTLLLSSCCNKIDKYKDNKPTLNFQAFYNSNVKAYGIYTNIFGKVESRFIMTSKPIENKDNLTSKDKIDNKDKVFYAQSIHYLDSGKKKDTTAYAIFDKNDPHHFVYKDSMMVNEATYDQYGNATNIKYDLNIERDDGSNIVVSADDWSYMIDENNIINKIKIKKFGFTVGYITMSIVKG